MKQVYFLILTNNCKTDLTLGGKFSTQVDISDAENFSSGQGYVIILHKNLNKVRHLKGQMCKNLIEHDSKHFYLRHLYKNLIDFSHNQQQYLIDRKSL